MRARRWVLFIRLNIIVSSATTLIVLSFKGELEQVVVVTATPRSLALGSAPTATPANQPTEPSPSSTLTLPQSVEYVVKAGDTLGGIALAHDIGLYRCDREKEHHFLSRVSPAQRGAIGGQGS